LARGPQARRFKSFREAVVYESQLMAALIALPAFSEQTRLDAPRASRHGDEHVARGSRSSLTIREAKTFRAQVMTM
jgi:hypothetical protein